MLKNDLHEYQHQMEQHQYLYFHLEYSLHFHYIFQGIIPVGVLFYLLFDNFSYVNVRRKTTQVKHYFPTFQNNAPLLACSFIKVHALLS